MSTATTNEEGLKSVEPATSPNANEIPAQITALKTETVIPTTPSETPSNEIGQDTIAQIRQSISDMPAPEIVATNPNPIIKHEIDPIPPAAIVNQPEPSNTTETNHGLLSLVRKLFSRKPKNPTPPPSANPLEQKVA